jgi:hypothetical protein
MFSRSKSTVFSLLFVAFSLFAELKYGWSSFFSCSGAVVTLSGLFLNIKHSLHFHLKIPKENIHYILSGFGIFGSKATEEDLNRVDEVLSDEVFGVAFMVIGTVIWAYGNYLVAFINPIP